MWNICRAPCLHSASDKISEISKNITWNPNQKQIHNESNKTIKPFDDKKIMVVDSQPFANQPVVSRVLTLDTKPIEPAVGRRKIVPDFDLVNNLDNNDLEISCPPLRQLSARTHTHTAEPDMDSSDRPDKASQNDLTEYQQSFTWNKVVSQNNHSNVPPAGQSEYRRSFAWPKQTQIAPQPVVEPPIVAERAVPGRAVPTQDASTKKSATISNFAEVVGKPDVLFTKETQPVPVVEKPKKKTEYNAKFRPFNTYMYVTGSGFVKQKNLNQIDEVDKAKQWFSEVEERSKQANEYKTRSQLGHPLASEGLTQIYSQGSIWNNYHCDRELQALALATTQKIIEEKKAERALYASPKPGAGRKLSSAPPSLRTEIPSANSQASLRSKSPHAMYRPGSADKRASKPVGAPTESPKPEGKIWIKPKPKTEANEPKKESNDKLPIKTNDKQKTPSDNGNGGPKSPRPTTLSMANGNGKTETKPPEKRPPLPSGPIRTTQVKSPEEITGVKSPSPESWNVELDKGLNWVNGETPRNIDNKYSADMTTIKPTPVSDNSKVSGKSVVSKDKAIASKPKASSVASSVPPQSKPTATVQPSPSVSLSSISNPSSKRVQSIEEEVEIVKPGNPRQKAGNVLDRAKHRLDRFWHRNK